MYRWRIAALYGAIVLTSAAGAARAQTDPDQSDIDALKKNAPKVYIDCSDCDIEYIKTEITYVNYVRDRKEAQVHVLITTQATGSGGREYTLSFSGQNEFLGLDDTITHFSNKTDTSDEVRRGLVKSLKLGLAGYAARTPIAARLTVSFEQPKTTPSGVDHWKNWVFSLSGEGYFRGEKSTASGSWGVNLSANRVTANRKIRMGLSGDFSSDRYDYGDVSIRSRRESYDFSGLYVVGLGAHWSAGFALDIESSTYSNTKIDVRPAPAVEFNVFPYAEATRRQLRFLYKIGIGAVRYREETIYDKTRETLARQSLSVTLDIKEKWGAMTVSGSGGHYFHNIRKYRIDVYGSIQVNIVKGLNAYVFGGGSRIRDQLSLIKGEATLEEILLRRRQLETGYNYFAMFGLSYTFGSIYTNVVNPRFGSAGGSGGVSIHID